MTTIFKKLTSQRKKKPNDWMWGQNGKKQQQRCSEWDVLHSVSISKQDFFVGLFLIFCKRALHYPTHGQRIQAAMWRLGCAEAATSNIKRCGAPPPPRHLSAHKHTWVTALDPTWETETDVDAGPNRRRGVFDCPTNLCALCDNDS